MHKIRRKIIAGVSAAVAVAGFIVAQPDTALAADEFLFATAPGPGGGPHVRLYRMNGAQHTGTAFMAFDPNFHGGVEVAMGDLDGDGSDEIIAAAGPGGGPHVRPFTLAGQPIDKWGFFAYDQGFRGGVHLGVADIDGDGDDEIVTGPGAGGGPHVRVWNIVDDRPQVVTEVMAYDTNFAGGVFVAGIYSDADSDEQGVVTGPGAGGGPHVKVFSPNLQATTRSFFAYDPGFTGGVSVAAYDSESDGVDEIVTGALALRGHVRTFKQAANNPPFKVGFYAFDAAVNTGVQVSTVGGAVDGPILGAPYWPGTGPCSVDLEGQANCGRAFFVRGFGENNSFTIQVAPYGVGWNGGVRVAGGFGDAPTPPPSTTSSTSTTSTSTTSTSTSTTTTSTSTTTTSTSTTTTTLPDV